MPTPKTDRLSLTPYQIVPAPDFDETAEYLIETETSQYDYRYPTLPSAKKAVRDFERQDAEEAEEELADPTEYETELADMRERLIEHLAALDLWVRQETDLAILTETLARLEAETPEQ